MVLYSLCTGFASSWHCSPFVIYNIIKYFFQFQLFFV
jgi:hypothetical protein